MLANDFEQLMLLLPKYDSDSLIDHTVNRIKEVLNRVDNTAHNTGSKQALREIAAISIDLDCHSWEQFTEQMYIELRSRLRQLLAA